MSHNAVDLFAGCGGLTEGLKRAGWAVRAAVEIDAKAASTYRLNHPEVALVERDIRSLNIASFAAELADQYGRLDLVAGCPPCQGFSRLLTKNRIGNSADERNDLIFSMLEFILAAEPRAVMLENVPALIRDSRFDIFCRKLRASGYKLVYETLDVCHYGVPQRRCRAILLATRGGQGPFFADKQHQPSTVRDAIGALEHPSESIDALHAIPERRSKRVSKFIELVPKDGGSRKDVPIDRQLRCHKRTSGYSDVYGRMAWDKPSPTITSGCSNPSKGRFIHPERNSAISLREAALLQGFPKNYQFVPEHGKEAIALMIGNALPPPFIEVHARALLKSIVELDAPGTNQERQGG